MNPSAKAWATHWTKADDSTHRRFLELDGESAARWAAEQLDERYDGQLIDHRSFENRVFGFATIDRARRRHQRVVKVYRPGRWDRAQLEAEHILVRHLAGSGLPVVPPLTLRSAATLATRDELVLAAFDATDGKNRDRESLASMGDSLRALGATIARLHDAATAVDIRRRGRLHPAGHGRGSVDALLAMAPIPDEVAREIDAVATRLLSCATSAFETTPAVPLHADLNPGNLLWVGSEARIIDFDDCVTGPPIHDLWMLPVRGGVDGAGPEWSALLSGYRSVRRLEGSQLALVPILRFMREVWFLSWVAARYNEPRFQRLRPTFREPDTWREQLRWFREQLEIVEARGS